MRKERKHYSKQGVSMLLSLAVSLSGISYVPSFQLTAEATDSTIKISSVADLQKIGNDKNYPMSGDYVLTADLDLSGINWTPIGGTSGAQYGLVSGDRVFTGTFDGAGHVIEGLTITYDGSTGSANTNQSGLFAQIGSDDLDDYAEVKNLNFTDVDITHTLAGADTIGTLAGDVNGYAKIDNIAVLDGSITVEGSNGGDLIGVGGVIGEVRNNSFAVELTNLYNGADVTVTSNVSTGYARCGGILGRIHQSGTIGKLSSCLNVGTITWKGQSGYAINGYSNSTSADSNTTNVTNCYYLEGTGLSYSKASVTELSESEMGSQTIADALGSEYWTVSKGQLLPIVSEGKVITPIPSPTFADGDKASAVTKNFTLPVSYMPEDETVGITWTSSDPDVIAINGGTATVKSVLADTTVTLTAVTDKGLTKTLEVTVLSNLALSFNQDYAKVGTALTATVENAPDTATFTYSWTIDGTTVSTSASYMPKTSDLNKFLTVTATLKGSQNAQLVKKIYCSKLPVVYIDTEDGYGITSKTEYKSATMHIQGNDTYNSSTTSLYDGGISIRGRGNSTWSLSYSKLPYKIKLDTKTNLFGFGTSKHWALLANYMDESLIRNTTAYDLSGTMGMPYLKSTHVEVILNGVYAGNYQLVGNVRIEKDRVDIYDWEDLAGDVAKAVRKAYGLTKDEQSAMEDYLSENLAWITDSKGFTYNGTTYPRSVYEDLIPKDESGNVDVSGGFVLELDEYYDEVSKFKTNNSQPINFHNPEYAATNNDLFSYTKKYIQAVEDSICSSDFTTTYNNETVSYTDLVDMDSLVTYYVLNELYWNTETMKKSTYMYKDLGEKLHIGPVWDMDWTSNSLVSASETKKPTNWMVTNASSNAQKYSWYKYLVGDPYFVTKVYECYQKNREYFNDLVKDGGIIDQDKEYLKESGDANYAAGYLRNTSKLDFESGVERFRTFLNERLAWMDTQCADVETLLKSYGKYSASSSISVTADTSMEGSTVYTATVSTNAAKVGFYINGEPAGTATVSNGQAQLSVSDSFLTTEADSYNTVQVRAMDASGNLLSNGTIQNYTNFKKEVADEKEDTTTPSTPSTGEVKNDHVIINQVYGGGANTETPVSHSFIELYNPTDMDISLEGYSIGYLSNGKNGKSTEEVKLSLNGTIPAKTSYLIRCEAQDTSTPELISLNIDTYDQEWSQTIDNKQFRIVLYNGTTIVDGISQGEEAVEGAALASGTASKQKALRRIAFADTNDNQADFEVVEYKKASVSGDTLATMRPRSLADGPWKAGDKYVSSTTAPVDPETPSTGETETETEEQSEKQTEKQTEPETNVQTEPETAGGSGETEKIQTPSIDKTTETEEGTTFTGTVKKVKAKVVTSGKKKSVKLSWKKAKGATKYMIYRSTKANKGFKRIAVIKKGSITTYTDKKVKKGKKYYYRVVAAKNGIYGKAVKSKAVKIKK